MLIIDNKEVVVVENGISILNDCYDCMKANDTCMNCQDERDAHDTDIAHEIVDSRVTSESNVWTSHQTYPSGHDWTERDGEFAPPIVNLADRLSGAVFLGKHIVELGKDDLTEAKFAAMLKLGKHEMVCDACHYTHNKAIVCPNCN